MFDFLKSVRFWKIVGASIVWGLMIGGVIDKSVGDPIMAILLGSVIVKTIDRNTGDTK